ncbi:hypothetical protein [Roseateles sp.]|uniref:hypothetical protein n=1 Tax=Roseateles sp. TaxID=1971397 RepID=UPI003BAAC288
MNRRHARHAPTAPPCCAIPVFTDLTAESRRQYRGVFDSFFQRRSQPTPGL